MPLSQPSGVADVGLPARHVLGVAGVHEDYVKPVLLEDLEGRYPVDPGGFHRHAGDAAGSDPDDQIVQVVREGTVRAPGHISAVGVRSIFDPISIAAAPGLTIFRSGWSPIDFFAMTYPPFRREGVGRASPSSSEPGSPPGRRHHSQGRISPCATLFNGVSLSDKRSATALRRR